MKYPTIPLAQEVVQLCHAKSVRHVVISPGSRNAPLTIGFTGHPEMKTYSIVDERCAAFFALGMAQQLGELVAIVCTSGSAMLNYYPAVAEAFYSNIPLLVISADRPKHLIDIGDGQTIRQAHVFEKHILYAANLEPDLEEIAREFSGDNAIIGNLQETVVSANDVPVHSNQVAINNAINIATEGKGPVHINVPFAEPLYAKQETFSQAITVIPSKLSDLVLDEVAFSMFMAKWKKAKKKMVLIGVNQPNTIDQDYLELLGKDESVIVFTESTSNLHQQNFFPSIDKIIAPLSADAFQDLQPDLLLTFGGMIVSKKIKAFLRKYQPKAHYHVGETKALDTFFCLKQHFKISPNSFFKYYANTIEYIPSNYRDKWLSVKQNRTAKHHSFLKNLPFCDLKAFQYILPTIPENSILHLSNSSTVRYVQLFNDKPSVDQYCNRGTSGIDGSTATAIGHAIQSERQNILITGDLSFFYDSNALWNSYTPCSFRIIIINNSGGGIFRILPGEKNTLNFDTYFETKHSLSAEHLAKMYGFSYTAVHDVIELKTSLNSFYKIDSQPKILEVFTPRTLNDEILISYFKNFND